LKVILSAGIRPNFMKVAPILEEMRKFPENFQASLIHTGQHYDDVMSKVFFCDLELPEPDRYLNVGSGRHAVQTAGVMVAFEKVLVDERPDLVIVVGDANSTLACALVAAKLGIKLAHVEAGLRSWDRTMPEEINRIVTDSISELLFTPSEDADENLLLEGIPQERIFFVGNIMVDSLLRCKQTELKSNILEEIGLTERNYCLLTLHRPSNVDAKRVLSGIIFALGRIQKQIKVVFPVHPRTKKMLQDFELLKVLEDMDNLILIEPLGYLHFLKLQMCAKVVLTDSGGVQEETTVLEVPCLTLRENTERPITVQIGTNLIVGSKEDDIVDAVYEVLQSKGKKGRTPKFWDGRTSERIVRVLKEVYA